MTAPPSLSLSLCIAFHLISEHMKYHMLTYTSIYARMRVTCSGSNAGLPSDDNTTNITLHDTNTQSTTNNNNKQPTIYNNTHIITTQLA